MPLSFPLIPPTSPATSDIKIGPNNIVGENDSPFTGSQQIFEYPGEWLEAELALPPMTRAQAEPWLACFTALRGKSGVLTLSDPNAAAPQGSAARSNVNLLSWSESFDSGIWSKQTNANGTVTVTPDATADPNGLVDADQIAFPSTVGLGTLSIVQVCTPPNGTASRAWTFSVWLKASSPVTVNIDIEDSPFTSGNNATCNVTTSWQRFSVTFNAGAGVSASLAPHIFTQNQAAATIFAWGAQLEQASSPSTYIGTSFGNGLVPVIAMNGATQGPKFLLLKGLAPNSVALKAGDYIESGYGLSATRVTSSGGAGTPKWVSPLTANPSLNGQVYVTSLRVRNIGTAVANISDNVAHQQSVNPGTEAVIFLSSIGNGSGALEMLLAAANISDPMDIVVWAPRMQRQGIDENLIPSTGLTFETGWAAFSGATVTRTQGYNRRLYKVLADATSDAKGNCAVEIFPRWRGDAVADGDPVNVFSPKGMFRLQDNLRMWEITNALLADGISLKFKEAF